jgi:hypothetical protein
MAQLREITVELRDPPAQRRTAFDQHHLVTNLRRLERGRDAGDAAANHDDGLASWRSVGHAWSVPSLMRGGAL